MNENNTNLPVVTNTEEESVQTLPGRIIGYFKGRREPDIGPSVYYAEANVREVEPIAAQDAPDPVRQGDTLCRASRMPKAVFTNIPGILSIDSWFFAYPLFAPSAHAHTLKGPGPQLAWDERTNIRKPTSTPYGSRAEVVGVEGPYTDVYAKLL